MPTSPKAVFLAPVAAAGCSVGQNSLLKPSQFLADLRFYPLFHVFGAARTLHTSSVQSVISCPKHLGSRDAHTEPTDPNNTSPTLSALRARPTSHRSNQPHPCKHPRRKNQIPACPSRTALVVKDQTRHHHLMMCKAWNFSLTSACRMPIF